jgi:hypothetical protein
MEVTQYHYETYSRIPKSAIKQLPETKHKEVATSIGGNNERSGH